MRSLWQSSRGEVLGKASMGVDTLDKGHHQEFHPGWIELVQRLQEGLGRRQGPGLVPSRWGTKGQFQ